MTNLDIRDIVMDITICIDYDNLLPLQKQKGILDIVTISLQKAADRIPYNCKCDVRLYGGWYEGENLTRLSQDISSSIQNDFPKIIKIIKDDISIEIKTSVELAQSLLAEPGHFLFNTYRRKGKPNNVRVEKKNELGCSSDTCFIDIAKKFIRTGKCPNSGCIQEKLIYRHEQKLVDTMLTCDLMHLAEIENNLIILLSADDDFLPPIRSLLMKGKKTIRIHPKYNERNEKVIVSGNELMEAEL